MSRRRTLLTAVVAALAATVLATASGPSGAGAQTEGGAPALTTVATLNSPIAMATRAGTDDLYVAQRNGIVRRLAVSGDTVTRVGGQVANISALTEPSGERGLFGLAFNPAGTKLYLHFTNNAGDTRLVEFRMSANGTGNTVIGSSRRTVLALDQPFPNHNGGTVTFGPDNRLYLALGDGGSGGDPFNNGQNRGVLLGKILRINPNRAGRQTYTSPGTNPFAGAVPGRAEIWLYGVRNPWRISFDPATGDLYVADVGQNAVEEVTVLDADDSGRNAGRGANLGWRRMEGDQPFTGTEPADHTGPTVTYTHDAGRCSVTGGYVYRGDDVPAYDGRYFYGDFCTGEIFWFTAVDGVLTSGPTLLGTSVPAITLQSFGQGADGELYVLLSDGTVRRLGTT